MKTIEIDESLYHFIASQTKFIGEDASSILRRLLNIDLQHPTSTTSLPKNATNDSNIIKLLNQDNFINEKSNIGRLLLLLSVLYHYNPPLFSISVASLHGSKRQYIAKDKISLEHSGKNTKPRQIEGTPYWVISNTNTARKIFILQSIMNNMEFNQETIDLVINKFTTF